MLPNGLIPWRSLSTSRIRGHILGKDQYQLPLSRWTHHYSRKQFTITSKDPNSTRPEDVLGTLERVKATTSITGVPNPGVILFTTPSFATWLEDKSFIQDILGRIVSLPKAKSNPAIVDTLLGVIDGIDPGIGSGPILTEHRAEGFAFMTGDKNVMLPALWDANSYSSRLNQDRRSSLLFQADTGPGTSVEVGISLANTIFRNGRTSTLLASRWQCIDETSGFQRLDQVEKHSQTVVYHKDEFSQASLNCSLTPLTPPRRIVSGLGNIARRIQIDGDKPSPASQELESSINAYFDAVDMQKQPITVWALVIPEEIVAAPDSGVRDSLIMNEEHICAFWTNHTSTNSYAWEFVQRGAGLYRVLSGGGGWGMKQGLLSLDPEIALPKPDESQSDSEAFNPMDIQSQTQALGDIARPGSYIQFFVAQEPAEKSSKLLSKLLKDNMEGETDSDTDTSFAIGCIPSRVDDMPLQTSTPDTTGDGKQNNNTLEFKNNHFGAQSESGIFVTLSGPGKPNIKTKINVPYSVLTLTGRS